MLDIIDYDSLTDRELLIENLKYDAIEQEREFLEMQTLYLDNALEA